MNWKTENYWVSPYNFVPEVTEEIKFPDTTYQEFLKLADKKKEVNDDDILMLAGADRAAAHAIKLDYPKSS